MQAYVSPSRNAESRHLSIKPRKGVLRALGSSLQRPLTLNESAAPLGTKWETVATLGIITGKDTPVLMRWMAIVPILMDICV